MIVDKVGLPATLEQCAEECSEFAAICLKLARKIRNENPTPRTFEEIRLDFIEELSDASLLIDILSAETNLSSEDVVDSIKIRKLTRWVDRINQAESESGKNGDDTVWE